MMAPHVPSRWLQAAGWRAALLAVGWWALAAGRVSSSLAVGVTTVAAATLASLISSPPNVTSHPLTPRPRALLTLAGTFLFGAVRGGWDVAHRALSPTLPLSPILIRYQTCLDANTAKQIFASLVTLMPGTLTADIRGRDLRIHALVDRGDDLRSDLVMLEGRVARAFGIDVEATRA